MDSVDKKIVYIGIAFIVAAIIVVAISASSTSTIGNAIQNTLITTNLTVRAGGISSTSINVTANSYIFAFIALNKSANVYLFNNSAYKVWINETGKETANSPTGVENAKSLEGAGVFVIYENVLNATVPANLGSVNSTPIYSSNQSQLYAGGIYDFVIDNSNGSASRNSELAARVIYLPPFSNSSLTGGSLAQLGNQLGEVVILGVLFFVLFIIGLALVIYGLIKKPKGNQPVPQNPAQPQKPGTQVDQQYVDNLYKNVDGKKRKKKKRSS